MAKYIPRIEDFEAVQWTGENTEEVSEFFGENFTRAMNSKSVEDTGYFGSLYIDLEGIPYMLKRGHWMIKPRAPYFIWQELTDLNFRLLFREADSNEETEGDIHRALLLALPTFEQRTLRLALDRLTRNKELEDVVLEALPLEDFINVTESMIKAIKAKKDVPADMVKGMKILQMRVDQAKSKRIYGSETI